MVPNCVSLFLAEDGETHSSELLVLGQWTNPFG